MDFAPAPLYGLFPESISLKNAENGVLGQKTPVVDLLPQLRTKSRSVFDPPSLWELIQN